VVLRPTKIRNLKWYDCKDLKKKTQMAVKWRQIRRKIELCMKEIISRFEINFEKLILSRQKTATKESFQRYYSTAYSRTGVRYGLSKTLKNF
jgi:hypothetical protein